MTYLLRLVACLFLCVSFTTKAELVNLSFSGSIDYLNDPSNLMASHDLSIGDFFNVSIDVDSSVNVSNPFIGSHGLNVFNVAIDSINASIDFGQTQETFFDANFFGIPGFGITYVNVGNDIIWDESQFLPGLSIPNGDVWGVLGTTMPSGTLGSLLFIDSTGAAIDDDGFFVNQSIQTWDTRVLSIQRSDLGPPLTTILVGITEVPLPAGITLFLSGLVGLGLMRGRNG